MSIFPAPAAPKTGDALDAEGFRIVTTMANIAGHQGEWASIVLPGRTCATSVEVRDAGNGTIELRRDGKGGSLRLNLRELGFMTALVYDKDGEIAGGISFPEPLCGCAECADDGNGVAYMQDNWGDVRRFGDLLTGLVVLAQMHLV